MTVSAVKINGQDVAWKFVQPTYPGDPLGDNDPDPRAHRRPENIAGRQRPVPARLLVDGVRRRPSRGPGHPVRGQQARIAPAAPVPAGQSVKIQIFYSGRPGVHSDGDRPPRASLAR